MLFIGLAVAIVIYPFFHETGHCLATLLVGGEIVEYHLFPLPNVLCQVSNVTTMGRVFIGIFGMLLPIIISLLIYCPKKSFGIWYAKLILQGICLLSLGITFVAAILFSLGNPVANEDITTVLKLAPNLVEIAIIASLFASTVLTIIILKDHPVKRIRDYLLE